jgi:hypothetical protein
MMTNLGSELGSFDLGQAGSNTLATICILTYNQPLLAFGA